MVKAREKLGPTMDNIHKLREKIETSYTERELELPKLVLIPRSAYLIGDTLSRRWNIPGIDILHACVEKVEDSPSQTVFREGQFPTAAEVKGENLLVVDAVCRTGDTLDYVVKRLQSLGANMVESAVLYEKVLSDRDEPAHSPTFFAEKRKEFIIFEWELPEYLPEDTSTIAEALDSAE